MSGRAAAAEKHVLELFKNHNRPFSVQGVADFVAQFGVKKPQVQKTLDSLAENEKLTMKEFGKTRIFWPLQSSENVLSKEETEAKKKELQELTAIAVKEAEELGQLQKEHSDLSSALTMAEIEAEMSRLLAQKDEIEEKLSVLREASVLVLPEEREKAEKSLQENLGFWKKWKAAFREIWGALSENLERKQSELFEEIGIDTDEDNACSLEEMSRLVPNKRRRFK